MSIFTPTEISDVIQIQPRVYQDIRGFFMETYQKEVFSQAGIPHDFVQDNHSSSTRLTLRGLHYQMNKPQGKLVRVVVGEIFDVAVDLRLSSPYYGKWVGAYLSEENKNQLWIPQGFAHGFLVLSDRADVVYKTTDYYYAAGERTICWDDPSIGIEWPIPAGAEPIVSDKDANGGLFTDAEVFS